MSTRWTPAEDALLLSLAAEGLKYRDIGAKVGRPTEGTRQRGQHLGVAFRRRRWNAPEDAVLASGVRNGVPFADLARTLVRSRGAVQVRASILGLTNRRKNA